MKTRMCEYCKRRMVWFNCEYPFWYHEGATPRHGDWGPDHNCVADASRASAADISITCGEES